MTGSPAAAGGLDEIVEAMLTPPSLAGLLGITLDSIEPGRAVCRLTITHDHRNQAAVTHGGAVFALADTAVGLASSRPGGPVPLGTSFSLHILRATGPGDVLVAEAVEEHRGRQLVSQRVQVRRARDDALVASLTAQLLLTRTPAGGS